jgi:hypothetical protein
VAEQLGDGDDVDALVLLACLLHVSRIRGRDELATMYCKRMARVHKQARDRFEALPGGQPCRGRTPGRRVR